MSPRRQREAAGSETRGRLVLAVDTATLVSSVALAEDGRLVAELSARARVTHSQWVLGDVAALLRRAERSLEDIDGFAATVGPGSFTGVRIGLTTCRTLAWTLGRPLVGLSSLDVLAMNAAGRPGLVATVLDARKKEVYLAVVRLVDGAPVTIIEPNVLAPEAALERLGALDREDAEPLWVLGDGVLLYDALFRDGVLPGLRVGAGPDHHARAAQLALLAHRELEDRGWESDPLLVEPLYIRPSEAELADKART